MKLNAAKMMMILAVVVGGVAGCDVPPDEQTGAPGAAQTEAQEEALSFPPPNLDRCLVKVTPRPGICPLILAEVCGCDGKTYPNSCVAASHGVAVRHQGKCAPVNRCDGSVRPPLAIGCPDIYWPVCGCDGQTYPNECEARRKGVAVAHERACGEELPTW
jgi:hypothetical protein